MILWGRAMPIESTTIEDFARAKRKAKFQSLLSALTWKNNDLLSLYEVTSIIKPKSETYLGMRTIPVSRIIGSEGRYHDFSSAFFPKREQLKARWCSIDAAIINDVILPPISVYSLGGYYFVRDGNHRVSVAKAQGVEYIDAEVVELDTEIPLSPGMSMKDLKRKVVDYERNTFISQYKPSYLPMGDIVFTSPGSYPEMVNHILVHKYYINQKIDHEISFEEAAKSWYENVYSPIVQEIRAEHLLAAFPGQSEGDMYMWLVRRWDEYKRKDGSISAAEAVRKAGKERGKDIFHRLERYLAYYFKKLSKS